MIARRDLRPHAPDELIDPGWRACLVAANQDRLSAPNEAEKKHWWAMIDRAASARPIDLVRSVGGAWLRDGVLQPARVTHRTAKAMPWVRSAPMIDAALDCLPLHGFVPVQVVDPATVIAPHVTPSGGAILIRRRPRHGDPPGIDLSRKPTPSEEAAAWQALNPNSGWGYGERLFQAARFVTEMEYQHLVFEEFARKVQPMVNVFGFTSVGSVS